MDYLPLEHEYLTYIKKVLRHRCRQAGFRRITPALLEPFSVFEKTYGGTETDAERVSSVIRNGSSEDVFVMRFDPVLSLARTYLEHHLETWPQPVELYFLETFMKKEAGKPVPGDLFGVGILGNDDAALTAQVIYLAHKILDDLGLHEMYTVQINHIGSDESRKLFREDLKNFYFDKSRSLCENCLHLSEKGDYLRLLRCHEEDCMILAQLAPKLEHYLKKEDRQEEENLKGYLTELGIDCRENKSLFGMGSFNANTVFEFWHNDKGSKNVAITGGSNDYCIEKLGGEKKTIIGFVSEVNVILEGMREVGIRVPHKDHIQVFIAQLGIKAKKKALSLLQQLRESGVQAVGAMGTGSMRTQLDMAMNFKVKYTILMGEVEVNEGMVIVRDMQTGTQESVPYDHALEIMQDRIGKEKMDVMEDDEQSIDLKKKK
jgi:histidyl-tRNA synthetase